MKRVYGNGIDDEFSQALTENAIATARYEALSPEEKQVFLARVREAKGVAAKKELLDELVGWQKGHGPYQL